MKEPEVKQVANLVDDNGRKFTNPHRGRVFSTSGISPAVCTRGEMIKIIIENGTKQDNNSRESDVLGGRRLDKAHVLSPNGICECITTEAAHGFPPKIMEQENTKAALAPRRNELGRKTRKDYESHKVRFQRSQIRDLVPRDDGICNTLTSVLKDNYIFESMDNLSILDGLKKKKFRIRKLTPRECFRLMGVKETDIDKIQRARFKNRELVLSDAPKAAAISKSQQYKMAGNSIVVDCLYYIFRNLFIGIPEEEKDTLF